VPPSEHVKVVEGSVLDRATIARNVVDIDLVLHLAAIVGMRRVYADPIYAMRDSDEGTPNVLAATGTRADVVLSSAAVHGLEAREVADETDAISDASILKYDGGHVGYAYGKRMLEVHGQTAMAAGRSVMILRPFNVVGPGQREDFGMVLPGFVRRARDGEPLQ